MNFDSLVQDCIIPSRALSHRFDLLRLVDWRQWLQTWWRHQMERFSALLALYTGIHRSQVNSPQKGQWRGALMFSLICVWINGRVNDREAGDLRRYRAHYDVTVMLYEIYAYIWPRKYSVCDGNSAKMYATYFWSEVYIWNVNCARATASVFDSRTDVHVKVSKFLRQKMSRPEEDSSPQPSFSYRGP